MKKIFIAMLSVVALAACSQDEISDIQREYIDFVPTAKNAVRATTLFTNQNFERFLVSAYTAENETVMGDVLVTKEATGWTYSPKKYWPEGTTVDFYGLYMENLGVTADYYQSSYSYSATTGYELNLAMGPDENDVLNATEIPDPVYAVALDKTKAGGAVLMQFRHAMAQVEFQINNATTESNNITIVSGDVYVDDLKMSGTYSLPTTLSTTDENGVGSWSLHSNVDPASYLFPNDGVLVAAGEVSPISQATCLVMPQSVTDVNIRVGCTILQDDLTIFSGEKTATATLTWVQGYKYIIKLLFDDSVLENDYINFTTNVIDMSSGGTTTVEPE